MECAGLVITSTTFAAFSLCSLPRRVAEHLLQVRNDSQASSSQQGVQTGMNGSREPRASDALVGTGRHDMLLTWETASRMLPLIRQIVADILDSQQRLARDLADKDDLDRQRYDLAWPDRARRYQLSEDIDRQEVRLEQALRELDQLGLALVDAELGQVGFPTIVNNRPAFFSWRPGEDDVRFWHFARDRTRRQVPAGWKETSLEETRRPSARKAGPVV
jgi:hypothetical protein